MKKNEQYKNSESTKKDISEVALSQLGYFTKDINLYDLFEGMGKSEVGKEMDKMGRYLFNHRFGGGHLWWKELSNRPIEQWPDVLEHLMSDFFTKAGLPYAFDGTMIKKPDLLKLFGGGKNIASYNNWAMINGFQFVSGSSSIVFSIYDAKTLVKGYKNDIALVFDSMFVALDVISGMATANPFLIVAAVIKTSNILRKSKMGLGITTSSPFDLDTSKMFDLNVNSMFNVEYERGLNVNSLLNQVSCFDFMYGENTISYDFK